MKWYKKTHKKIWTNQKACVLFANVWIGLCWRATEKWIYQMLELVNWQNEMIGANEMNIVVRLRRCCAICSTFLPTHVLCMCAWEFVCVCMVYFLSVYAYWQFNNFLGYVPHRCRCRRHRTFWMLDGHSFAKSPWIQLKQVKASPKQSRA